jgi:hypothetical protein
MKTEMTIRKGQLPNEWQVDWRWAEEGQEGQNMRLCLNTFAGHPQPRLCDLERAALETAVQVLTGILGSTPPYQDKPPRSATTHPTKEHGPN